MTKLLHTLLLILCTLLVSACATLPGAKWLQLSVTKGRPFVIQESEAMGWGRGTHLYLAPIRDDRIALTYWVDGDGAVNSRAAPVSWPLYSDDNGSTWQAGDPYQWEEKPNLSFPLEIREGNSFTHFNKGLFFGHAALGNGTRVAFSRPVDERTSLYTIRSLDSGYTWRGPERVTFEFPEDGMRPDRLRVESPAQVIGERILLIAKVRVAMGDPWSTWLFESFDEGRTLRYVSTVAGPEHTAWARRYQTYQGPGEAALLALSDTELISFMRTGIQAGASTSGRATASPMLFARSTDGGLTWDRRRSSINGVMPKLIKLESGVLVLATGRPGNRLHFSTDNGRSWGREINITPPNVLTTGYCDIWEIEPGRILVVYDIINSPLQRFWLWEPRRLNAIMAVHVDVQRRAGN